VKRVITFKSFKKHCSHGACGECGEVNWWKEDKQKRCNEKNCPVFKRLKKLDSLREMNDNEIFDENENHPMKVETRNVKFENDLGEIDIDDVDFSNEGILRETIREVLGRNGN
jgi:hypothetical protein